jgi:hypothetical protein
VAVLHITHTQVDMGMYWLVRKWAVEMHRFEPHSPRYCAKPVETSIKFDPIL